LERINHQSSIICLYEYMHYFKTKVAPVVDGQPQQASHICCVHNIAAVLTKWDIYPDNNAQV